jgi:hypothetical protein
MVGLSSHHCGRRQIRTEAAAFELNIASQRKKFTVVSFLESASRVPINYVAHVENGVKLQLKMTSTWKELHSKV